jgi:hypothetical protein
MDIGIGLLFLYLQKLSRATRKNISKYPTLGSVYAVGRSLAPVIEPRYHSAKRRAQDIRSTTTGKANIYLPNLLP